MENAQKTDKIGITGKYKISKFKNGILIKEGSWKKNLVVSSDGYGRNLIARQMAGNTTYPIEIDGMSLSTNNTTPTVSDTSLGGTVGSVGVELLTFSTTGEANEITFSGFFTDGDLTNGTYYKIGITMNGRLFTSALLDTPETKDSGEEYRIDYQIDIN